MKSNQRMEFLTLIQETDEIILNCVRIGEQERTQLDISEDSI